MTIVQIRQEPRNGTEATYQETAVLLLLFY